MHRDEQLSAKTLVFLHLQLRVARALDFELYFVQSALEVLFQLRAGVAEERNFWGKAFQICAQNAQCHGITVVALLS